MRVMDLFIVESPNKVKKIQKILGDRFLVMASVGHVRDLPEHELGVEPPKFRPHYQISDNKQSVVRRLQAAAKRCRRIYLGTDPDREGEAIAWHVAKVLGVDPNSDRVRRVRFQEISRTAILKALEEAGPIDFHRVAAQESRRVIDRLVGYLVSPAIGRGMSAGRVQSPSVRLVVEREREIRHFRPETYYEVRAHMRSPRPWSALWDWKPFVEDGQAHFFDRATCEAVARTTRLTVVAVKTGRRKRNPPPPFITSTLQQAASSRLHFAPEKTMTLAQSLFAAGAITYHRTDNPNLSDEAIEAVRALLQTQGHALPERPNRWRAKSGAQEAHEAIRPVDIALTDAGDNEDERALYRLIRNRTLACQMLPAVYDVRVVVLEGDVAVPLKDRPLARFVARGEVLSDQRGWLAIETTDDDAKPDDEHDNGHANDNTPVPDVSKGDVFDCRCEIETRKTQPPPRYTEASLVKTLERLGIGRPSTYATIIKTIKRRQYVEVRRRKLYATQKGEALCDNLQKADFRFYRYEYTAQMEAEIDKVSEGKSRYLNVVSETYAQLTKELARLPAAATSRPASGQPAGFDCPKCKTGIEDRETFWRCPKCRKNLFKESYGHRFTEDEAKALFAGRSLKLNLVSKKGKPYRGVLSLGRNRLNVTFDD